VYFGLLSILTQVGVAESEKQVAAIFLLPVSPLEPPKRSFLPFSGSYGCLVADRRPKNVAQPSTPTTQSVKVGVVGGGRYWQQFTVVFNCRVAR